VPRISGRRSHAARRNASSIAITKLASTASERRRRPQRPKRQEGHIVRHLQFRTMIVTITANTASENAISRSAVVFASRIAHSPTDEELGPHRARETAGPARRAALPAQPFACSLSRLR